MAPAAASPEAANSNDSANKKAKIHNVVSHEEWITARKDLLIAEKEMSKQKAALAQKRRDLPWEEVKEDYEFETMENSVVKLSELCQGEDSTVVIQHFMFSGGENGCHLCSFFLDSFSGIYPHLKPRLNFCAVALASPEDLAKVQSKKGWSFPMVSSRKNSFQRDYGVHWTKEEVDNQKAVYNYDKSWSFGTMAPGISVFHKVDGKVYHTYSTYAAGLADLNATFAVLDITPTGRNETGGPASNMWWVKHKESY